MSQHPCLSDDFLDRYEVHNFRHALEVLSTSCANEFSELISALGQFRLTTQDILTKGGNESQISSASHSCCDRQNGLKRVCVAT